VERNGQLRHIGFPYGDGFVCRFDVNSSNLLHKDLDLLVGTYEVVLLCYSCRVFYFFISFMKIMHDRRTHFHMYTIARNHVLAAPIALRSRLQRPTRVTEQRHPNRRAIELLKFECDNKIDERGFM
jgi:hypothetical protein